MPEQTTHSNESWRSLDTLIKYVKGNLLGQKKQEVEDQAMASPLISDAIDGLKELGNLAKTQSVVDSLNRQIQIKSGAATPPKPSESKATNVIKTNPKAILLAAASVVVIISATLGLYKAFNRSDPAQNTDALVQYEEKKITNNYGNASKNEEPVALDTASIAAKDSVKTIALLKGNDNEQADKPLKAQEDASEKTLYETEKPDDRNKNRADKKEVTKEKVVVEEEAVKEEELIENKLKSNAISNSNMNNEGRMSTDSTIDSEDNSYASGYGKFKAKDADSDAISYTDAIKHLEREEYDKAIAEFEAISKNKNSSYQNDSYWNLAQIYIKQGDSRNAKKMLKKLKDDAKYGDQAETLLDDL